MKLYLFWPVIVVLGPGMAGVFYENEVKPFSDKSACERTLPTLEQLARQTIDFMAMGINGPKYHFELKCIDEPPEQYQPEPERADDERT